MNDHTLKIANRYGTVDVRGGISQKYVHVPGRRLQPICRKLRIKFADALVGFDGKKRFGYSPVLDGVVVSARSAPRLLAEIEARDKRSKQRKTQTPEQRAEAKKRQQLRDIERFAAEVRERLPSMPEGEEHEIAGHACVIGSGRVGRSQVADDSVMAAVVAHVRHCHTDYDEMLDAACADTFDYEDRQQIRQDIREQIGPVVWDIIEQWQQANEAKSN